MELKPCPFCGATEPTVHLIDAPESAVVCDYKMGGCGADAGLFNTNGRAIEAWNNRAQRAQQTCQMTEIFCGTASGIEWVCSECGSTCFVSEPMDTDEKPRYCPNCGAKVVETRESKGCEYCQTEGFDGQFVMMSNHGWQHINYCPNCGAKVIE